LNVTVLPDALTVPADAPAAETPSAAIASIIAAAVRRVVLAGEATLPWLLLAMGPSFACTRAPCPRCGGRTVAACGF
jgi:hypothetical protein